jgi:hypothetical protein
MRLPELITAVHHNILFHTVTSVNCLSALVKRSPSGLPKVHPSRIGLTEKTAMHKEEDMLQAEIEFWRFMIESRKGVISEQATERMLNACELAERRLMMLDYPASRTATRQ